MKLLLWLYLLATWPCQRLCQDLLERIEAAAQDAARAYRPWDGW